MRKGKEVKESKKGKKEQESAKEPTLDDLMSSINGALKYEAVFRATDPRVTRGKVSSGIYPVDIMLRGGFKVGATHEVYGDPSVGKTSLVYRQLGQFQREFRKPVGFIDLEHSFDPDFAETQGMDCSDKMCLVSHLNDGGDAIDVAEFMVRSGQVCAIAIDSVSALATKDELNKRGSEHTVGGQARLMSAGLRKLTTVNQNGCTVFFINQQREKVGGFGGKTTSGGRALAYYATTRIEFRRGRNLAAIWKEWVEDDDGKFVFQEVTHTVGHVIKLLLVKAKCGAREKDVCSYKFWHVGAPGRGLGPSDIDEALILAVKSGLLSKGGGGWYSWKDDMFPKSQGDDKLWKMIVDNQDLQSLLIQNAVESVQKAARFQVGEEVCEEETDNDTAAVAQ